jgi:pimeloyl-ACP methyl ester carboxylesterase
MTTKDGHGSIAAPEGMAVHSPADTALPRLDGVEHRFVDLPQLRMHVAQAGSRDPVLLLHGFPQHWWEWRKVIPGLAQHHRVICPDLRGAGWTDAPPAGYTRGQLLADVVALLDTLKVDRVHLIAHDAGVPIGFELCLNHPDRVRNYLALSVPHPYIRFSRRMLAVMWHDLWLEPVLATPLLGPGLMGKRDQRFVRFLFSHYTAAQDAFSEKDIGLFAAPFREPARARAASALYRHYIAPTATRIMTGAYRRQEQRLRTPTRLLFGAEDRAFSRPELYAGHQDYADDLRLRQVAGAAHFIADERPDAVVEHALEFFTP